ncbi:MAG: hypothetical protein IPH05_09485 [Flavobacteriales bacterium]|nr:hypothetical protein [Flavobacteriales bacterium]
MDLRERYDPEDIQSLLSERAYDELLAEERAFVLRHLSGKEEYDRMRAMLHHVRPDERSRIRIEEDDAVRRNVLEVFRDQQRPSWRIWLNTLAAWFAPRDVDFNWRPVLAFATLAVLIVVGVFTVREFGSNSSEPGLAEVKSVPTHDQVAPVTSTERPVQQESTDLGSIRQTVQPGVERSEASTLSENEQVRIPMEVEKADGLAGSREDKLSGGLIIAEEEQFAAVKDAEVAMDKAQTGSATSHVVTVEELATNMTLANEAGKVRPASDGKRSAAPDVATREVNSASRSLAQDPALLNLLAAGW